ncbi:MAG: GAF domain-containing protein [Anaerolineales bacterium]|nr:GAF domain-containing protein [Anaerolineales bacterium]
MRVSDSVLLADRIAIIIRWLSLLGLMTIASRGGIVDPTLSTMFMIAGVWNTLLSLLTLFKRRLPLHRFITVGADLVIAAFLFLFSGNLEGPLLLAGVMPLSSAALYFELYGGLIQSALTILLFAFISFTGSDTASITSRIWIVGAIFLVAGAVIGFIARQFNYAIRHRRMLEYTKDQESRRKERERVRALYNITSTLNATLNYQRVLDLALDLSSNALADPNDIATLLVSAFYLYETDRLYVGSARRFTPADLRVSLQGTTGLIGEAINVGEARYAQDPSNDPELGRIIALRACNSYYCYPLRTGLDVFGVMVFGHPDPEYFSDTRREILSIIGRQAQVALQNASLYHELEEEKRRIIDMQGEEQKKLARDLHDGPTQSIAAIAMRVNFARRLMERDPKSAGDELYKIEDLARRTTKEIRHMLFTLRPLVLESSGLIVALESMAEKMNETYNQNVIIEADQAAVDQLEMGKQGVIFYIAEEAVNNARKHAEAEHIWVRVKTIADDIVILEIQDDGVGFNVGAVDAGYENRGSLGMVNMRERSELVSGILKLESAEGKGTRIRLWIPLTDDAVERIRHGVG